jgi:Na+/H+ antiporter NhaA
MSQMFSLWHHQDDLTRLYEYSQAVLSGVGFALTLFVSPIVALDDATSNYAAEREGLITVG